ncbi:MAG: hypothetical protein KAJ54_03080 [Candidatus Aenigmarchaeota archaeon]|nr:hypothetical protein [Candidatus Aenigmarchaeota archaeon]MCK5322282.1 hypothetical protein [Candidatus Aenigmarchaeota archaeon]
MPATSAPYKRGHHQTKGRGQGSSVTCEYCGRTVLRMKCFPVTRGFRITDPQLRRELDRDQVSGQFHKMYVCPACARHRRMSVKKDSRPNFKQPKKF